MKKITLAIAGETGCGKSTMLWCYQGRQFNDDFMPTVLDVYSDIIDIQGERYIIEIHDTAGHLDLDNLTSLTYSLADVVIFCYSCVDPVSLSNIEDEWIPKIKEKADSNTLFILAGTKLDLFDSTDEELRVTVADGDRLTKAEKRFQYHGQCSAKQECSGAPTQRVTDVFKNAILSHFVAMKGSGSFASCTIV